MNGVVSLLAAALLGAAAWCAPPSARHVDVELTGQEILIEAERVAPGAEPAGIYACLGEGKPVCLLPMGRFPRWSPTRRFVACVHEGQPTILDRATGGLERLTQFEYGYPSAADVFSLVPGPGVEWLPDEAGIIRWVDMMDPRLPVVARRPKIVWRGPRVGGRWYLVAGLDLSVGRLSFRPGSESMAYEAYSAVPDLGTHGAHVILEDSNSGQREVLTLPAGGPGRLVNPLWAPIWHRLAVDAISDDGRRSTWVWTAAGRTAVRVPMPNRSDNWSQACGWSPDGAALLVITGGQQGWSENLAYVAEVPDGQLWHPPTAQCSFSGYAHAAAFSGDGKRVAVLQGQRRSTDLDMDLEVVVCERNGRRLAVIRLPGHLKPVRLTW